MTRMAYPPLVDHAAYARDHLFYEATMFVATATELEKPRWRAHPLPDLEQVYKNALLESCGLHLRNLIEFFYPLLPKKPRKPGELDSDVAAEDYVSGWGHPASPTVLKAARRRANKELAHLTTERITTANKDWSFREVSIALAPAIRDFLRRVPPSRLSDGVANALRTIGTVPLAARSTSSTWIDCDGISSPE